MKQRQLKEKQLSGKGVGESGIYVCLGREVEKWKLHEPGLLQ